MNQSSQSNTVNSLKFKGACAAILSGATAGVIASALDLHQACGEIDGAASIALLTLGILGRLAMAGSLLSLIVWGMALLGATAARRLRRSPGTGATLAIVGITAPGLVYVSMRLFQGGVTSQLPARPFLIGAVALLMIVLVAAAARAMIAIISAADEYGRKTSIWPLLVSLAFVLGALGMRWCDAHMYRRLYLYLHVLLAVGTLGGIALALRLVVFPRFTRIAGLRVGVICLIACAVLAILAGVLMDRRQVVKVAVYERTATTANVLLVTTGPRKIGEGPRPTADIRRIRYERERQALRASASGDFPVFPGAHFALITVDALRADRLGLYGYIERDLSPRLNEWAKTATVFERAYCAAPHSSYSITSFHTSHYTHDEAMLGVEISHPTIAEILRDAKYKTSGFYTQGIFFTQGDQVGHYRANKFGFETANHGAPPPDQLTDNAIAEMDRLIGLEEPAFYSWIHYFNVHEPYKSERFGTSPKDRYEGEIVNADREVGRLLDYIESKLARDTIIVFTGDHGEEFKDHGGHYHGSTLYEEQVRVPLIIKVPGAKPGRIKAPVSLVDIAPTVLELLGVEPPAHMVGQDLRPAIFGGDDAHVDKPVFSSVMRRHMALLWPWKLISDPSRGLYELYNLETDPVEKINQYDKNKKIADDLLQETFGWLDEISRGKDAASTAINLGRMRDKRSIPGLLAVAQNSGAPMKDRVEALQLLAEIKAWRSIPQMIALLKDREDDIGLFAALALAAVNNDDGRDLLRDALYDDDPDIRDKAAISLGNLGDPAAVPVLIEALGRNDLTVREKAIRLLGDLRDPRATEPLIETISEDRTRYLSVLALGKIGDPRAFDTLMDVLEHETHTDIRGYVVVALGWLELEGAESRLMRILDEEPEIKWTSEALVRLGAIENGGLFGTDIQKKGPALKNGWGECTVEERVIPGEFMGRTTCATIGHKATLEIKASAPGGAVVFIRARHLHDDNAERITLRITIDGVVAGEAILGAEMEEHRIDTTADFWSRKKHNIKLEQVEGTSGKFEVDHFLVVPRKAD